MGPCVACNGPHLIKDCTESICNGCKPNLDNNTPAKSQTPPITITTALEINLMVTMTLM